jgi:hypothetical protein
MPKCPKCKKQITHLVYRGTHSIVSDFDKSGNYENEGIENYDDMFYSCPECEATLFEEEDGALEFLNKVDK